MGFWIILLLIHFLNLLVLLNFWLITSQAYVVFQDEGLSINFARETIQAGSDLIGIGSGLNRWVPIIVHAFDLSLEKIGVLGGSENDS